VIFADRSGTIARWNRASTGLFGFSAAEAPAHQMGLIEEAREAWRDALRVIPAYSLEHRRKVLPYKNPEDFERVRRGSAQSGPARAMTP
jgi:hypothetical protein